MTSRRRYQRGGSDDTPWRLASRQDAPRGSAAASPARRRRARGRGRRVRRRRRRARPAAGPRAARARLRGRGRRVPSRVAPRRLGGRVIVARALRDRHGRASTDATFDLAGARRERYERPGALPDVELGASLREDLERRDFTVNAIALHLADGELTWLAGRARGPRRAARCGCCTTARSSTTRRGCCGWRATRARLGFEPERAHRPAGRRGGRRRRARHRHRLAAGRRAAAAAAGAAAGGAAGARAPRARAARCWARLRGRCRTIVRPRAGAHAGGRPRRPRGACRDRRGDRATSRRGSTTSRSRPPSATSSHRAAAARRRARRRSRLTDDAELWRALRKRAAGDRRASPARCGDATAAARRWLDDVRHRRLAITATTSSLPGLYGPAGRRGARPGDWRRCSRAAPHREEQLAAALG